MLVRDEAALPTAGAPDEDDDGTRVRRAAMACTERLDAAGLEALLRRAGMRFGAVSMIEDIVVPFLHAVGERWHRSELTVAHEHVASGTVERVLHWLLDTPTQPATAPVMAVATTQGERHAIGIQIAAAIAAAENWRVLYLGADLPTEAIISALSQHPVTVLAVSLVSTQGARAALPELRAVRNALPPGTLVVAGGAAAASVERPLHDLGIRVVRDLAELRAFLAGARQR
jgi:methanogenic corrinoid protein MtbC1